MCRQMALWVLLINRVHSIASLAGVECNAGRLALILGQGCTTPVPRWFPFEAIASGLVSGLLCMSELWVFTPVLVRGKTLREHLRLSYYLPRTRFITCCFPIRYRFSKLIGAVSHRGA